MSTWMDLSISVPSHTSCATTRVLTIQWPAPIGAQMSHSPSNSQSPKCACYLLQESSQSSRSNSLSMPSLIANTGTWVSFLATFPAVSSTDHQVLLISFPKHSSMRPFSTHVDSVAGQSVASLLWFTASSLSSQPWISKLFKSTPPLNPGIWL